MNRKIRESRMVMMAPAQMGMPKRMLKAIEDPITS